MKSLLTCVFALAFCSFTMADTKFYLNDKGEVYTKEEASTPMPDLTQVTSQFRLRNLFNGGSNSTCANGNCNNQLPPQSTTIVVNPVVDQVPLEKKKIVNPEIPQPMPAAPVVVTGTVAGGSCGCNCPNCPCNQGVGSSPVLDRTKNFLEGIRSRKPLRTFLFGGGLFKGCNCN